MEKIRFQTEEELDEFISAITERHEYGKVVYDIDEIKEAEKSAREFGSISALNFIGNIYYQGNGIEQDKKKAFELYKESSYYGNSLAASNLGFCYYLGNGVEKNFKEAYLAFVKASILNSPDATIMLGDMHRKGEYVQKDEPFAYYLYQDVFEFCTNHQQPEELGFLQAYSEVSLRLAICSILGEGCRKDISKAEYYLSIAKYHFALRNAKEDYYAKSGTVMVDKLEMQLRKIKHRHKTIIPKQELLS